MAGLELPLKVLFLCTGNSCRSVIAEALANHLGQGRLRAESAGSQPTGRVNPHALAILEKHGVPDANPRSQSWDEFADTDFDLVITVCDNAAGESCPVWLADTLKAHWGVPDPADASGSDEEIEQAFERTYQQMKQRIESLLALPLDQVSPQDLSAHLQDIHQQQ